MASEDDGYFWRSSDDAGADPAPEPPAVLEHEAPEPCDGDAPAAFVAPVDATRPASEGAARRRSTPQAGALPAEPGSLASKVLALRVLEDDIASLLGEVESALRSLESDRTLEDAGFRSAEDFRERVSTQMGLLHEMREPRRRAPQATGRVRKRSHGRPRAGDMRARRTQALTAIEQTMARFRELGLVMGGKVEEARNLLANIDCNKTFAECGYASFDEFLELAIGPSPILTKCITVLGEFTQPEPVPEPEPPRASASEEDELPSFADPPGPVVSDDRPPALFELPPDSTAEEPASGAPADEPPLPKPRRVALVQRSALVVSVGLGVIAALIGTLAGVRASHAAEGTAPEAEVPAAAAPADSSSAPHHASAAAAAEAKHGSVAQVQAQAPATANRRGHEERVFPPASASPPPPAPPHSTGPKGVEVSVVP